MNEKFLFRGKREDTGNWVEGYYVELPEDQHGKKLCLIIGLDGQYNRIIPETAGRCTGFTDKNDVLFFEGDIIKNIDTGDIGVVRWYDEHGAFMIRRISDNQIYWLFDNDFSKIEIVSNIHDNKQMLRRADMPVFNDVFQPVLKSATPENFVIAPA